MPSTSHIAEILKEHLRVNVVLGKVDKSPCISETTFHVVISAQSITDAADAIFQEIISETDIASEAQE